MPIWRSTQEPENANFGGFLDYFGIPSKEFTDSELQQSICPKNKSEILLQYLKMCPKKYVEIKSNFDTRIQNGSWSSMMDQLEIYNLLDCQLLQEAWEKYTDLFYEEFQVDAQEYMSLSQLAQSILFRHYPVDAIPMITLPREFTWLNREIRNNLYGGLAAVFSRHAETSTNSDFPSSVYHTPNGSPIVKIQQLGNKSGLSV